jgi:hypothetical protein
MGLLVMIAVSAGTFAGILALLRPGCTRTNLKRND